MIEKRSKAESIETTSKEDVSYDLSSNNDKPKGTHNTTTAELLQNDPKVKRIRKIAIVVLLTAAVGVSGGIYTSLVRSEEREFQNRFEDQAKQIGQALEAELDNKLRAIDALSVTITSFAGSQSVQWPNITVPEFSYRAASALSLGRALSVALYPIVSYDQMRQWEIFSVQNQQWVKEVVAFQAKFPQAFRSSVKKEHNMDASRAERHMVTNSSELLHNISDVIFHFDDDGMPTRISNELMLPMWQHAPVHPGLPRTNYDAYAVERNREALDKVMQNQASVLGQSYTLEESCYGHDFPPMSPDLETETWDDIWTQMVAMKNNHQHGHSGHTEIMDHSGHIELNHNHHEVAGLEGPAVNLFYPVFSDLNENRTVVSILALTSKWDSFLLPSLPPDPNGLMVTMNNECGQSFTFEITGEEVIYLGPGDHHEAKYGSFEKRFPLTLDSSVFTEVPMANEYCTYTASVYPSSQMREEFASNSPMIYTVSVAVIFFFTIFVFVFYDYLVQARQRYLVETASKSNAIISSLFPQIVRDRLMEGEGQNARKKIWRTEAVNGGAEKPAGPPIANFFANTTVMFGDIAGFTAWSSSRQPSEVFALLESLYGKMDSIAREMKVFKVETIGDCYVAVTGLPNPQEDHHLRMVKFATRVLKSMGPLTRQMEVKLGPGTTKLGFRVGLHSGPVTAGVLRGEKSRFQLFGDTMNMASRMESTGKINFIQVSNATARLIVASGKDHWISKREDMVEVKGKGTVQTYWVTDICAQRRQSNDKSTCESSASERRSMDTLCSKDQDAIAKNNTRRSLVEWQVELLSQLIKQIVAKRKDSPRKSLQPFNGWDSKHATPRDEIVEELHLPSLKPGTTTNQDSNRVKLSQKVQDQLHDFVTSIAMLYRDNGFHNYEHACHVTMSANKFLMRVVNPQGNGFEDSLRASLRAFHNHEYAYGLTGDPLTQFAIIFSALIHDIDHQGVSNKQLSEEDSRLAMMYNGKSPAEQNSIDLAFEVLGSSQYHDLVSCICANEEELKRFRQLVVNCVMATDIFDKDLLAIRNKKWKKAFKSEEEESSSDLKATIVIEHIIQAADVAHTMQHWHVYQKWNEKLFFEMCTAHEADRGPAKDPALGWYEGELWFFDNYVIPLAKKLEECGVFGVSSDECLNYALENRKEWEIRGRDLVTSMKERYAKMRKEGKRGSL
ncbi:unnamed protein product [Cylindrotheca closterium]|uniref:Phosphodiesterase n=1 Tax=Cylindrotheca closterium TaxID=2856 RepID=A0AAD2G5A3_9STRA|nr:unnamed protein product [Cylindrotheca closterium]